MAAERSCRASAYWPCTVSREQTHVAFSIRHSQALNQTYNVVVSPSSINPSHSVVWISHKKSSKMLSGGSPHSVWKIIVLLHYCKLTAFLHCNMANTLDSSVSYFKIKPHTFSKDSERLTLYWTCAWLVYWEPLCSWGPTHSHGHSHWELTPPHHANSQQIRGVIE